MAYLWRELWSEGWGAGTDPADDENHNRYVVEDYLIAGGTGRFENASGNSTVERAVFSVDPSFVDLASEGSIDEVINFKKR
ncbi:hypothetical protein N9195_01035 [bacterium]|nr:hypothetical protein [bacterium]